MLPFSLSRAQLHRSGAFSAQDCFPSLEGSMPRDRLLNDSRMGDGLLDALFKVRT